MAIRAAHTHQPTPTGAAAEIGARFGGSPCALVIYFASPAYPQDALAAALKERLGTARTLGCSTSGEIGSLGMTEHSVVALGLGPDDLLDFDVQLVDDLRDAQAVHRALDALDQHFGGLRDLDLSAHVGLVLMDGMSGAEESTMEILGERADILFVGGSAGDDLAFQRTWVHVDGRSVAGGAVLAVLRPARPFQVLKTQSFEPQGQRLVATGVDESTRTVSHFDGLPATTRYADALGVPEGELDKQFMAHPLGLMVGKEPFVRSPQQVVEGSVKFYCAVREGMELSVLTSGDMISDTRTALERATGPGSPAAGLLLFNCILRTLDLRGRGQSDAYGRIFADIPTAGFSTYGEAYLGHVNQTATMLLFH